MKICPNCGGIMRESFNGRLNKVTYVCPLCGYVVVDYRWR